MTRVIPLLFQEILQFRLSLLLVSVCRVLARFVEISNTVITPVTGESTWFPMRHWCGSHFWYGVLREEVDKEGARFEAPTGAETIGPDSSSSFRSQSLAEGSEAGEEPINPHRKR